MNRSFSSSLFASVCSELLVHRNTALCPYGSIMTSGSHKIHFLKRFYYPHEVVILHNFRPNSSRIIHRKSCDPTKSKWDTTKVFKHSDSNMIIVHFKHTVPSESIHTTLIFPHFVTLQPYSIF